VLCSFCSHFEVDSATVTVKTDSVIAQELYSFAGFDGAPMRSVDRQIQIEEPVGLLGRLLLAAAAATL
jgi:hypothetical protein